jgi:hypothetical protein
MQPSALALKGPPEIAQGWSEALTLGLHVCFGPALKGRPKLFGGRIRTPLQGLPLALPLTQGFTLRYVRSPRWGCFPPPFERRCEFKKALRHPERSEAESLLFPKSSARAQPKDLATLAGGLPRREISSSSEATPTGLSRRHAPVSTTPPDVPRRSFDFGSATLHDKTNRTARLRSG